MGRLGAVFILEEFIEVANSLHALYTRIIQAKEDIVALFASFGFKKTVDLGVFARKCELKFVWDEKPLENVTRHSGKIWRCNVFSRVYQSDVRISAFGSPKYGLIRFGSLFFNNPKDA